MARKEREPRGNKKTYRVLVAKWLQVYVHVALSLSLSFSLSDGPLLVSIRITVTPGHPQFYHPPSRKDSNFLLPLRQPSYPEAGLCLDDRFFCSLLSSSPFFFLSSLHRLWETQSVSHRGLLGFPPGVCVCVCVCERERESEERGTEETRRKLAGCLPGCLTVCAKGIG